MTVSVLILGIIAAAVIPHFSSTDYSRLDLAAREYADAIRFARSESMRLGEPRGFNQNSAQKRIRVFRADTDATPWAPVYDIYHPVSKKLYDIRLDTHPFAKADSVSVTPAFRGGCNQIDTIYFDVNGIPRCIDPQTVLLDSFDLTLTLDGESRVVSLQSITGQVILQ
jgi:hypothetical protein